MDNSILLALVMVTRAPELQKGAGSFPTLCAFPKETGQRCSEEGSAEIFLRAFVPELEYCPVERCRPLIQAQ